MQDSQCEALIEHLSEARTKPSMIFIAPGPKFFLSASFKARCELLSKDYYGCVITGSTESAIERYGDFLVVAIKMKRRSKFPLARAMLAMLRSISKSLAERGKAIDIVISYDPLLTGIIGFFAARWCKAAFVVEVNGCFGDAFNYVDVVSPMKRTISRILYPRLAERILRRANGIKLLFPSQIEYAKGIPQATAVGVFPSLIDLERFEYICDDKEILFVGHPLHRKGVDLLVQAFHIIKDEFPDWRLTILGWFPDKSELLEWIDNEPRITVHAPVANDQMPEFLGRCGLFVLPSRSEGMGRVLIETAASRKARIGANVGGIPTVIEDGVDGLLFESESVEDLAQKLRKVLADSSLRQRLGDAAQKRAHESFSEENWLNNCRQLYGAAQQSKVLSG